MKKILISTVLSIIIIGSSNAKVSNDDLMFDLPVFVKKDLCKKIEYSAWSSLTSFEYDRIKIYPQEERTTKNEDLVHYVKLAHYYSSIWSTMCDGKFN